MLTSQVRTSRRFLDDLRKSERSAGAKRTQCELALNEVTVDTLAPIKRPMSKWLLGEDTEQTLERPPEETCQDRRITLPALSELIAGLPGLMTVPLRRCATPQLPCNSSPGGEKPQSEASSFAKRRQGYDQADKAVYHIEAGNRYRSDAAERHKKDLTREKNREKQRRFRARADNARQSLEDSVKAQNGTIQHITQQVIDSEDALNQTRRIFFDWVEVLEARIKESGDSNARIQAVRDEHLHLLQMYAALGRNDERNLPVDLDRTFKDI